MKPTRIRSLPIAFALVVACAFLASAPAAEAAHGVVDLSWNTCAPVVQTVSATPGMGSLSLFVSELGNDQRHIAYQARFQIGSMNDTVPDAWRFDVVGCPGSSLLAINHLPPAALAKSCPPFQGTGTRLQIKNYDFFLPGTGFPTTLIRGLLANTYDPLTANATQRYFLAEFRFDHTFSVNGAGTPGVTCGGLETPMIIRLLFGDPATGGQPTSYIRDPDGLEFLFEPGNTVVTVNGAVPTNAKTWGQVKNAYHK